jgi:hypothetical protein
MLTEKKLNEISPDLEQIPRRPCTGNQGFKTISMNFHITLETETI